MRMMSIESKNMVYHRPQCRYAQKIQKRNRVQMYWHMAENSGYQPCKCCDTIRFLYRLEEIDVQIYAEKHNMNVDLVKDEIIVRTDAGCWKILYSKKKQKFKLLHRNYVNGRIFINEVDEAPFHRQKDFCNSDSIMQYVKYIKAHDEFKLNPVEARYMPRSTGRQKNYYRSAKKREEKHAARRLDSLFLMIEKNESIKKLSFC